MKARSVLIVDDHPAWRAVARLIVEAAGLEITAEAATGRSALDIAAGRRPDIVLLDVHLPDLDGIVVAERLAEGDPPRPVVVLVSSADPSTYAERLDRAPAREFIRKEHLTPTKLKAVIG